MFNFHIILHHVDIGLS